MCSVCVCVYSYPYGGSIPLCVCVCMCMYVCTMYRYMYVYGPGEIGRITTGGRFGGGSTAEMKYVHCTYCSIQCHACV